MRNEMSVTRGCAALPFLLPEAIADEQLRDRCPKEGETRSKVAYGLDVDQRPLLMLPIRSCCRNEAAKLLPWKIIAVWPLGVPCGVTSM